LDLRDVFSLCDIVRETAFSSHCYLRHGYREYIYENSLAHRLIKQGLNVVVQPEVEVHDEDGTLLGTHKPDIIVEDVLLLELKACIGLVDEHIGQVLGYLRAAGLEHGLLINFGTPKLQVKKIVL